MAAAGRRRPQSQTPDITTRLRQSIGRGDRAAVTDWRPTITSRTSRHRQPSPARHRCPSTADRRRSDPASAGWGTSLIMRRTFPACGWQVGSPAAADIAGRLSMAVYDTARYVPACSYGGINDSSRPNRPVTSRADRQADHGAWSVHQSRVGRFYWGSMSTNMR